MLSKIVSPGLAEEIAAGGGISTVELAHQHRTSPSTIFRWITRGLPAGNGSRVKLPALKRGKKFLTTARAVAEFFAQLPLSEPTPITPATRTPAARGRDTARAKAALNSKYGI